MVEIGINEAKAHFSRLVPLGLDGEEVIITRHGRGAVMLPPVVQAPPTLQTVRGVWKGPVRIADDFDELPEEIGGEPGIA